MTSLKGKWFVFEVNTFVWVVGRFKVEGGWQAPPEMEGHEIHGGAKR